MGKAKAFQFQTAVEQLKKQNDIATLNSSSDSSPLSPILSPVTSLKRPKCNIPDDLDLDNVYNPKYTVVQLISTRRKPRKQTSPPRPPNSFFLFKNCYMLELRKLGYRFCMPDVCRQSKQIWSNIPPEVKDKYDILALQAQILHQEMYPGYKFSPKKRQIFKPHVFSHETTVVDSSMLNTFSVTNFLGKSKTEDIVNSEPSSVNSVPSPVISETSQLYSPPHTPPTPSNFSNSPISSPCPTISSSHESVDSFELMNPQQNFVDYNNFFYYLDSINSINDVLIQSPPEVPSHEVNDIYSEIMSPVTPLEFLSYSDDLSAYHQLC